MKLEEKLQLLRKKNGYSQEQLADKIGIARQTISKWENGQAMPELNGLISLSEFYGVTIDNIVKEDDECNIMLDNDTNVEIHHLISFLIRAKKHTYAAGMNQTQSTRMNSHDYSFQETPYQYHDTYLGAEKFSGEEAVWFHDTPVWCMNYTGRVIGDHFNSHFLKEALFHVDEDFPYRGPRIFTKGNYHYHCNIDGAFHWFQGYEEIFYLNEKIYECYFHGGAVQ